MSRLTIKLILLSAIMAGKESLEPLPFKQYKGSLEVLVIVNLKCQGLGRMRQMRQYKRNYYFLFTLSQNRIITVIDTRKLKLYSSPAITASLPIRKRKI